RAVTAVLRSFGPRARPALRAALEAGLPDPRMERWLVDAVAATGDVGAAGAIAARLGSSWRDPRLPAARAPGRLPPAPHPPPPEATLADPEWQVRAQAAHALARLEAVAAVPALRRALTDRAWWVRRHAAYALASLGEPGLAALREAAAGDA